jgi:hypothetical protein
MACSLVFLSGQSSFSLDERGGRPPKERAWDESYTGALLRCTYNRHEELWGDDCPLYLQPQYFYSSSTRCIYCYKYLCNMRHASKRKDDDDGDDKAKDPSGGRDRGPSAALPRLVLRIEKEEEEEDAKGGVACKCGVNFDDGRFVVHSFSTFWLLIILFRIHRRMVECILCKMWHHTSCHRLGAIIPPEWDCGCKSTDLNGDESSLDAGTNIRVVESSKIEEGDAHGLSEQKVEASMADFIGQDDGFEYGIEPGQEEEFASLQLELEQAQAALWHTQSLYERSRQELQQALDLKQIELDELRSARGAETEPGVLESVCKERSFQAMVAAMESCDQDRLAAAIQSVMSSPKFEQLAELLEELLF